jgi:hypothetical protein
VVVEEEFYLLEQVERVERVEVVEVDLVHKVLQEQLTLEVEVVEVVMQ